MIHPKAKNNNNSRNSWRVPFIKSYDFLKNKSKEWLNLLQNTPITQQDQLQKKAIKLLTKDADTLLDEHRTHLKP